MAGPWLSVIVPTYNGAAYVGAAFASVEQQSDNGIEVIAIDDGSSDNTLHVLNAFAGRLPIHLVARQHVGNWVTNINYGLHIARGAWISILHQDDVWMPGRVKALQAQIERHPHAGLILHSSWFLDSRGRRLGQWRCPLQAGRVSRQTVLERLLVQNFIALPAPIFRRELACKVGGLDEELWYTADWDFWLKLAAAAFTVHIRKPLTGFRIHGDSQTVQRSAHETDMRKQMQTVLERHLKSTDAPANVQKVAHFAVEMNVNLARALHRTSPDWRRLAFMFAALGPFGWRRFFRDSRITERLGARLIAHGIHRHGLISD